MPIRVSICVEGSQLAISVLQWLLPWKRFLCPGSLIEGRNVEPNKWRDAPRVQETSLVLVSISRLSATSRHQPLANSMLTLLWARGQSRWLLLPWDLSPLQLRRAAMALQKFPKSRKTTSRRVLSSNLLFANWKVGDGSGPPGRSFLNELVGRCILQPHGKELATPPTLPAMAQHWRRHEGSSCPFLLMQGTKSWGRAKRKMADGK